MLSLLPQIVSDLEVVRFNDDVKIEGGWACNIFCFLVCSLIDINIRINIKIFNSFVSSPDEFSSFFN